MSTELSFLVKMKLTTTSRMLEGDAFFDPKDCIVDDLRKQFFKTFPLSIHLENYSIFLNYTSFIELEKSIEEIVKSAEVFDAESFIKDKAAQCLQEMKEAHEKEWSTKSNGGLK